MELISRDEAIVMLEDMEGQRDEDGYIRVYKCDAIDNLRSLPIIEERNEGEWIHDIHYGLKLPEHRCSICGEWEYSDAESKYCPNCGARMKGE